MEIKNNKLVRVQRRRTKGWKMPENTVYVGRPGVYGNPFVLGMDSDYCATRKACVGAFEDWLHGRAFIEYYQDGRISLWSNLSRLKGKNLACFCPLDEPCHADVLLKLANS